MTTTLTDFGSRCRSLRSKHHKLMSDQAAALGVSSAFVSAVETGRKAVPQGYVDSFCSWLKLSGSDEKAVRAAADGAPALIKIRPQSGEAAKLVRKLEQSIDKLSPAQIRQLREILEGGN